MQLSVLGLEAWRESHAQSNREGGRRDALRGLTSVFGMGTGGSLSPLPPEFYWAFYTLKAAQRKVDLEAFVSVLRSLAPSSLFPFGLLPTLRLSFALSLKFSLDQALDLLVSASSYITAFTPLTYQPCRLQGVLPALAVAVLFSRWASRLDAFSVYPLRTSLPSYAFGKTTVAPEVRPSRSSRTRDSSCHDSCAHDG